MSEIAANVPEFRQYLDPNNSNVIRMDGYDPTNCGFHFEPNNFPSNAQSVFPTMSPGFTGFVKSYVFAPTDRDYFIIDLPFPGVLDVTLTDLAEDLNLRLVALDNSELDRSHQAGTVDESVRYNHSAATSTSVLVEVEAGSTAVGSCDPYKIEVAFSSCSDALEPNSTMADATPVHSAPLAGAPSTETIQTPISSSGDVDYFEVEMANTGVLEIQLDDLVHDYDVTLIDVGGSTVASDIQSGTTAESFAYTNLISAPVQYFIKVEQASGASLFDECAPYELQVDWTPSPASGCIPIKGDITETQESTPGAGDGAASVTVTAGTPPYTYAWSPVGGSGPSITGLAAGSYEVTVTGSDGCSEVFTTSLAGCASAAPNNLPCCAASTSIQPTCDFQLDEITADYDLTDHLPVPLCDEPGTVDMWYQFTVTGTGIVSLYSRTVPTSPLPGTLNDIGIAFYTGTCDGLTELDCFKNSLSGTVSAGGLTIGNDFMPVEENIDLSAYVGQTLYMRIWEYGIGLQPGNFEFCLSESTLQCDDSYLSFNTQTSQTSTVPLGQGNLVTFEQGVFNWQATATRDIPNGVLGLYLNDQEIHRQTISVLTGESVCICPPPEAILEVGDDVGVSATVKVVLEENTSNLASVSETSPFLCREEVTLYTRQITIDALPTIRQSPGDVVTFRVNKNIQEPVELWVHSSITQDSFLVTTALDFDNASYSTPLGVCSRSWTIPSTLPAGIYFARARGTISREVFGDGANFIIGECIDPFIALEQESVIALDFLCFAGLIDPVQDSMNLVNNFIRYGEATPLTFDALYYQDPSIAAELPSDSFPVPFLNLQTQTSSNAHFFREARALHYLHYDDPDEALPRNDLFFPDTSFLTRAEAIRLLMEAFDVFTPVYDGTPPFADISNDHPTVRWVDHAANVHIVQVPSSGSFRPDDPITYEQFYVYLFRVMTGFGVSTYIPFNNTKAADYYVPGNYSPQAMPYQTDLTSGVYGRSIGPVFAIPGKGQTLRLSFMYNTAVHDLPKRLYRDQDDGVTYDHVSLGEGWSHSFDARVFLERDDATGEERYVFVWPGAVVETYDPGSNTYDAASLYQDVTISSSTIEVETREFMRYVFDRLPGTDRYLLSQIIDRFGNAILLDYVPNPVNGLPDRLDRVWEINNPGVAFEFTYSPGDPWTISSITETAKNRTVTLDVVNGRLNQFIDPMGSDLDFTYQPSADQWPFLMTAVDLPQSRSERIDYRDNKVSRYALGATYFVDYDWQPLYADDDPQAFTRFTTTTNVGIQTTVTRDILGRTPLVESPTGDVVVTDFGTGDNAMQVERYDLNGVTYTTDYNAQGLVTLRRKESGGLFTEWTAGYDPSGRLLTEYTDPNGNDYQYQYDASNALERLTLPDGEEYTYTRNATGQVTQTLSPMGYAMDYDYDPTDGLLTSITDPDVPGGASIGFDLDEVGNPEEVIDPSGNEAEMTFNNISQVTEHTDALGAVTAPNYDSNHDPVQIQLADGTALNLTYTSEEGYLECSEYGSTRICIEYAADGRPVRIDKGGQVGTYDYDPVSRQTTQTPGNTITYDGRFRVEAIDNTIHAVDLTFTYDNLDRVIEVEADIDGVVKRVGYAYDDNGNVTSVFYGGLSSSQEVEYEYDDRDRCTAIFDWTSAQPLVEYTYDADGKLVREDNRNGTFTAYRYDAAGRLERIRTRNADNDIVASNAFVLDTAGLHEAETFMVPGLDVAFPQLGTETINYGSSPHNQTTSMTVNGVFNGIDFDAAGNVVRLGKLDYTWDFNDRLMTVRDDGSLIAEYAYDGLNHRRWKEVDDPSFPTVDQVWYNLDIHGMGHVISEEVLHDDGSTEMIYHINGPNGKVARLIDGEAEFFHYDYRGSVLAMTDSDGDVVHAYAYLPFGAIEHISEGPSADRFPNDVTYVGKWGVQREVAGHYYMRNRYMYEPLGKFLAQDPVWATNLYPYAGNNPIDFIDPDGRYPSDPEDNLETAMNVISGIWSKTIDFTIIVAQAGGDEIASKLLGKIGGVLSGAGSLLTVAFGAQDAVDACKKSNSSRKDECLNAIVDLSTDVVTDIAFNKLAILAAGACTVKSFGIATVACWGGVQGAHASYDKWADQHVDRFITNGIRSTESGFKGMQEAIQDLPSRSTNAALYWNGYDPRRFR